MFGCKLERRQPVQPQEEEVCGGVSCVSSECSRMLPPLQGKDTVVSKQRHSVTPCCCCFFSLPVFTVESWPGPFLLRPAGGAVSLSHVQQ